MTADTLAAIRERHDDCSPDWCAHRDPGGSRQVDCDTAQVLAALDVATPPPGTRLVLMSDELAELMFTRDASGRRLVIDWREPDERGWYTPTLTARVPGVALDADETIVALADALEAGVVLARRLTRWEGLPQTRREGWDTWLLDADSLLAGARRRLGR